MTTQWTSTQQALEAVRAERRRRELEAAEGERKRQAAAKIDIADWAESRYYIKETRRPIILALHQKAVLRGMFKRHAETNVLLYHEGIYSTIQKSGKTTTAGVIARWYAETQTHMGEVYCIGNDKAQAQGRVFLSIRKSIQLTPGCHRARGDLVLPGTARAQMTKMQFYATDTTIEAISVDAAGEAGSARDLTCWTEFWGFRHKDAEEFWDEMGPIVTKPDSFRLVESYAGYSGESKLLERHYNLGKAGRQLTNGEIAEMACREVDGERYEDMLWAFTETNGDPHAPVPIWVNENAGLFMYWDEDEPEGVARRMANQNGPDADAFYREAANTNPKAYERVHRNKWTSPVGEFVPMEAWDACREELPPFLPENKEPCVLSVDAGIKDDNFAIVAVTRNPNRMQEPAIRACKKFDPKRMGGVVDFSIPEAYLRCKLVGGCMQGHPLTPDRKGPDLRYGPGPDGCGTCRDGLNVPPYNIQEICYDVHQMTDMMQRLRREIDVFCKQFDQGKERLIADHQLYTLILQRRIAWDANMPGTGAADLREHVENAVAKLSGESKMRIDKKAPDRKVDLLVAASMGVREIMRLMLTPDG